MGKLLINAEEILAAQDLKYDAISVPEWGGDVRVRGATAEEYDEYDESCYTRRSENGKMVVQENFANARARLVVKCVVDEDGDPIFKPEHATALGKKNDAVIQRLYKRIQQLSGRTKEAQEKLEGNSEAGQDAASPSSSPAT